MGTGIDTVSPSSTVSGLPYHMARPLMPSDDVNLLRPHSRRHDNSPTDRISDSPKYPNITEGNR
jgi:hypothetical protein